MTISFIIEERQIDPLYNNECSEKWFDYTIIRPELSDDLKENKPHTYPIIQKNGCTINGWALIQACKAVGIKTILCRVIQEDIPDNDLPDLVVSLNNQRKIKSWEQCEIALHFLPTDSQQGKSNGGRTKWDIAKERARVNVSGDTIKEYYQIKEWVDTHPESKILDKVKSHSLNALAIRTAYQNVIQERNKEEAGIREEERIRKKMEEEAKRKEQQNKSETKTEEENPGTTTTEETSDQTIENEPEEEYPDTTTTEETSAQSIENESEAEKPRIVLSESIAVADSSHFMIGNINLWLQDNRQPWILKSEQQQVMNELIRLTVISPPYLNQRNYTKLGLYKTQSLLEYLNDLYEAIANAKKYSHKNGVIAMNIGDAYKWGANYNIICRIINRLCDELGLVYMFKQVWHKPHSYNKGNPALAPTYNYEEIIYFCCSDERPQFNPLGYGDLNKEIGIKKVGGRRNPDGTKTEPRMTTNNFYKTFHQSIDQQQFFDTITSVGTDDEHQELKAATGVDHPALMPLVIPLWPIMSFSKKGDVVMDCYSGTATTLCTSLLLGRKAWGIEKEEEFFKGSIDRLKSMCQHYNPDDAAAIERQFCMKFYSDIRNIESAFIDYCEEKKAS